MNQKNKIKLKLLGFQDIKNYFYEKEIKNIILFSQARSGSTFVSNILSQELGFNENFFPEEFFINKHFSYLKRFIEKHDNFFINTNEFLYKRTHLKKKNTLHIYLYRNYLDIFESYKKAKERGFYLGWEEFYSRYRPLFPKLKDTHPITLFNHKVWEEQISNFENGLTLSYESFKSHPKFMSSKERSEKITTLKQTDKNDGWKEFYSKYSEQKINFNKKIKFNLLEKFFFKFRRLTDSRKKNMRNY